MNYHKPVLLNEALEHLKINKGKKYIDATLGDGGHTLEILKRGGTVLGIDYNDKSLERAKTRIESEGLSKDFVGVVGNFKNIDQIAQQNGFEQVDGIIYDLGYSSYELDAGGLGLSFSKDEALDMRLDNSLGVTAADLVNTLSEKDLEKLIRDYSDEKLARKFAKAIVKTRSLKKIQTTKDLADLLKAEAPPGYENGRIHPATRTFQAFRIIVNDELKNLDMSLPRAAQILSPGGVLVIISFHSLEDGLVKKFGQKAQPLIKIVTKKPVVPSREEVEGNVRSRSAKMRVFEKYV